MDHTITKRKARLFALTLLILGSLVTFAVLRSIDRLLFATAPPRGPIGDENLSGLIDPRRPKTTVNTLDLYPWTGGHTQAHFSLNGGKFRSGDHGFFVDFDLDQPPAKGPKELRVILIGGSAAAGWGADANDEMLYRMLERRFRESKPCGAERTLTVVNLAMGGAIAHQNFNALNIWGHALEPDLILSFSGVNDLAVWSNQTSSYGGFFNVQGSIWATRAESNTWIESAVTFVLPNMMKKTALGTALRGFHLSDYIGRAVRNFESRFPDFGTTLEARLEPVAVRWYVHSLKSIKRDFLGIPMFVVFQPLMATTADPGASVQSPMPQDTYATLYSRFIAISMDKLRGYMNAEWYFLNGHHYYKEHMAGRFAVGDGVHLSAAKQAEFAKVIGEQLFPVLCRLARKHAR